MLNNSGIHGNYSTTSKPLGYYATEGKTTYEFKTTSNGGDTTGSATPSISVGSTGSGTAFSIIPPYLVVNVWKRLS